jgi:hypothetical protein
VNETLTNAERLRRLRLLRDSVERQPDELFDMSNWGRSTACGTAACAFGAYILAHGPEFGVRLSAGPLFKSLSPMAADGLFVSPEFHFGLGWKESDRVFMPSAYEDDGYDEGEDIPKVVVLERIDALIRQYQEAD